MQDLASIVLAVSLECQGLAGRQEPHKADFCLDVGLRNKWEPATLSARPHAAVPCRPAPRLAHTGGQWRRGCGAPCSPANLPAPFPPMGGVLGSGSSCLCFFKGPFIKNSSVLVLKMQPK